MKTINHSVINSYELFLDKESGTAELHRYNRPATACDHGEEFVIPLSAERYYKLAETFQWVSYLHEYGSHEWYSVGVTCTADCYRTGALYRQ